MGSQEGFFFPSPPALRIGAQWARGPRRPLAAVLKKDADA